MEKFQDGSVHNWLNLKWKKKKSILQDSIKLQSCPYSADSWFVVMSLFISTAEWVKCLGFSRGTKKASLRSDVAEGNSEEKPGLDPACGNVVPAAAAAEHHHGAPLAFSRAPPKGKVRLTTWLLQAHDGQSSSSSSSSSLQLGLY